jgi:DNA-binding MarR family transcriptional regulator
VGDVKPPKTQILPNLPAKGPESSPSSLTRSSRSIFALLTTWSEEHRVIEVSLRELSRISRLSLAQVRRALLDLEAQGLIRWERSVGRGHRSRITLLPLGDSQDLSPNQSLKGTNFYDPHPLKVPNNSGKRGVIHSQKGRSARKEKPEQEKRNVSSRYPRVLRDMPRSCSVLFDIILERAGDGPLEISLSELCRLSGFTKLTVRRALRRLEAVRLIRREGGGGRGRKTRIFLLWKRFPQGKGLPVRSNVSSGYPENERNPSGGRPFASTYLRRAKEPVGEGAHFWALGEIRRFLLGRPAIEPGRRAAIMACLGPAVYRAVRKGRIKTFAELETLVGIIETRLEERRGLGLDLPATRRWAEWAVREALRQIEEERERREAEEEFIRKLLREREEARRAWEELLERGKTFPAVFGRDNRGDEFEPRGEGEAPLRAFELGAGLPPEIPSGRARGASGDVERGGADGIPAGVEPHPQARPKASEAGKSLSFPGLYGS